MGDVTRVVVSTPQAGPDAPVVVERPTNVPEKFWNAETKSVNTDALLASYSELEKKQSDTPPKAEEVTPPAEEGKPEAAESGTEGDEVEKAAEAAAEKAGVDMDALQDEMDEHGSLTDASYEKLAKAGFDKGTVDEFIEYRQSKVENYANAVRAAAGSEGEFEKMVAWAGKAYNQDQATVFNEAVNSGNKAKAEAAVKALKADYGKANGVKPTLITPTTGSPTQGERYESLAQMMADQAKPEYRNDPAFRQRVYDKAARSNI